MYEIVNFSCQSAAEAIKMCCSHDVLIQDSKLFANSNILAKISMNKLDKNALCLVIDILTNKGHN